MRLILGAMTTGAPPHKQQLHWHPDDPAASPSPKPAAKSSHRYNRGGIIFMAP